jgi:hypothetical protein
MTHAELLFWARVDQSGGPDACWPWLGYVHRAGYGMVHRPPENYAHRAAYRYTVGPVPEGLTLDHLCRNLICCNPAHLEPVTQGENNRRAWRATGTKAEATHCKYGHAFTPENTRHFQISGYGIGRTCRTCHRERALRDSRAIRATVVIGLSRVCLDCGGPLRPEQRTNAQYCSLLCAGRASGLRRRNREIAQGKP